MFSAIDSFAALREQASAAAASAAEQASAAAASAAEQASAAAAAAAEQASVLTEATKNLSTTVQLFPEEGVPPPGAPSTEAPAPAPTFALDDSVPQPPTSTQMTSSKAEPRPPLDALCEQQRRALEAGEERVRALVEELNQTKLKALKRLRAQEETIAGLEASLKQARSKESALQLENARLRASKPDAKPQENSPAAATAATAATPAPPPPATPAPAAGTTRTPHQQGVAAGAADSAALAAAAAAAATPAQTGSRREAMLVAKVTEQAAELHRERAARLAAERAAAASDEVAAALRQSLVAAEAAAERSSAESRSLSSSLRRASAMQSPPHRSVAGAATPATSVPGAAAGVEDGGLAWRRLEARLEAAEAARAKAVAAFKGASMAATEATERADEIEANLGEARLALATAEAARDAAAEEARDAKAEAKQVKLKARALLGQQEEEMRRRTLPPGATAPLPAGGAATNGAEPETPAPPQLHAPAPAPLPLPEPEPEPPTGSAEASDVKDGQGGPGASLLVAESADEVTALHRFATAQARMQSEVTMERSRRQTLEGELSAAQHDLHELRQQAVLETEGGKNAEYLKQVVAKFIELEGADESEALFTVIATYLQFEEDVVVRLQRARAERRAAARGRLSRLFGR